MKRFLIICAVFLVLDVATMYSLKYLGILDLLEAVTQCVLPGKANQ